MKKVKITVLKKEFYSDFADKYISDGSVRAVSSGGTFKPWNNKDGQTIVCCTDGIRPVVFNVEAIGHNDTTIE